MLKRRIHVRKISDTRRSNSSDESRILENSDQTEDENIRKEEKRKKARLRTRGPYRKAHANW